MKCISAIFLTSLAICSTSIAQGAAEGSPEKAITANDRAYEAAYAKGDVKALADFFADDADYTAEDGQIFSGRQAIEQAIRTGLTANPDSKLVIGVDGIKVLTPETLLQRGETTVTGKDGESSSARYTAIHVKKDGKWKIQQLLESAATSSASPRERLREFDWLLGRWEESDPANKISVSSQYTLARGGNFITRNVTVKQADQVTLEGWQIIGWDPLEDRLRTWTFDDGGGYSEGYYTRDGDRWLLRETGVAADGTRTSSDQTIAKLGPDRFTWESNNRTLNGDPQPAIGRIEIRRVKGE